MNTDRYCIIYITEKDKLSIDETIKVFYKNKYIDKYSKLIDKNKLYSIEEANEVLRKNSTYGFIITTNNDYNKGVDMIEECAYLEENSELNFETINWKSIKDYIKEVEEQGYTTEELAENEFKEWVQQKFLEQFHIH